MGGFFLDIVEMKTWGKYNLQVFPLTFQGCPSHMAAVVHVWKVLLTTQHVA